MPQDLIRMNDLRQARAEMPGCPLGLRPLRRHNDSGADLMNGESDDGDRNEFCEFCLSRRFNPATSARNAAISSAWLATSAASPSYDRQPPAQRANHLPLAIKSY
jgi:hypothetical protein